MLALKPFDTPMLNIWETAGLYARVISLGRPPRYRAGRHDTGAGDRTIQADKQIFADAVKVMGDQAGIAPAGGPSGDCWRERTRFLCVSSKPDR